MLNETGSIIHKVRRAGHPAHSSLAFVHHTYSSLLPLMLVLFHLACLSPQCADAHHGKLQMATPRFQVKSQKKLTLGRLRADPLALAFSFFFSRQDQGMLFYRQHKWHSHRCPQYGSHGDSRGASFCLSAEAPASHLITHSLSRLDIRFSTQPYMQAEFAGVFLYSVFESLSLCLYFFRAHSASESGYSSV